MDGGGKVTRRNPTGHAPVATGQGSRGASRVSRGASRGGRSHTVSDGHVDTEDETYWPYEDSTYQPKTPFYPNNNFYPNKRHFVPTPKSPCLELSSHSEVYL
ncbi:unnamed protein product [Cuscuta epithymum]|uniref:Uncharacterized protein n=1 Tax=Cuscuta epithymum TaxID=186058 RepID=A0AAV0EQ59_9ASTE|nr:unnamed protein product [Cuscuta epithymum]